MEVTLDLNLSGEPKLPLSERGTLLLITHALVLLLREIGECALCPRGAVCAPALRAATCSCRREPGNRCERHGAGWEAGVCPYKRLSMWPNVFVLFPVWLLFL